MNSIFIYSKIKYPGLRQALLHSLDNLSNKNKQLKEWIKPNKLYSFWGHLITEWDVLDGFDYIKDSEEAIGIILINKQENNHIRLLFESIDILCETIGPKQPDSAYINSPLWDDVVNAAKAAFDVFMANEEKARLINPQPWKGEEN